MITEKDFFDAIEENVYDIRDKGNSDRHNAAIECYELATKMAIEFANWINTAGNGYLPSYTGLWYTQPTNENTTILTTEQLFELYIKSTT